MEYTVIEDRANKLYLPLKRGGEHQQWDYCTDPKTGERIAYKSRKAAIAYTLRQERKDA